MVNDLAILAAKAAAAKQAVDSSEDFAGGLHPALGNAIRPVLAGTGRLWQGAKRYLDDFMSSAQARRPQSPYSFAPGAAPVYTTSTPTRQALTLRPQAETPSSDDKSEYSKSPILRARQISGAGIMDLIKRFGVGVHNRFGLH